MRWAQGRTVIDSMLERGELERVALNAEHTAQLIAQARRHAASAQQIADAEPAGAFQLLYDAARKSLVAILENQGTAADQPGRPYRCAGRGVRSA
jgi:hypothetical protein